MSGTRGANMNKVRQIMGAVSGLGKPCRDDGCAVGLDVDVGALKKDGHVPEQRNKGDLVHV